MVSIYTPIGLRKNLRKEIDYDVGKHIDCLFENTYIPEYMLLYSYSILSTYRIKECAVGGGHRVWFSLTGWWLVIPVVSWCPMIAGNWWRRLYSNNDHVSSFAFSSLLAGVCSRSCKYFWIPRRARLFFIACILCSSMHTQPKTCYRVCSRMI